MKHLCSKPRKYYVYDLESEEQVTRLFNTIEEADEALLLFAGLISKNEMFDYLQSPDCRYEIRTTTEGV